MRLSPKTINLKITETELKALQQLLLKGLGYDKQATGDGSQLQKHGRALLHKLAIKLRLAGQQNIDREIAQYRRDMKTYVDRINR
jgi:hypothetical protein